MTQKELKNIAPKLFEIQKLKHGFTAPSTYFKDLEEEISAKIFIDTLPNNNPFKVPEKYFDNLESTVFKIIKTENATIPKDYFNSIEAQVFEKLKKQPKVIPIRKKIIKFVAAISVAASILAIITFSFLNTKTSDQFASLKASEIEIWMKNGELNFDTDEIAYLYEDTTIKGLNIYDYYNENEVYDFLTDLDVESLILANE